jgi:hypothetical protein
MQFVYPAVAEMASVPFFPENMIIHLVIQIRSLKYRDPCRIEMLFAKTVCFAMTIGLTANCFDI